MENLNSILYPQKASKNHPYTSEVIKIAEDSGLSITEIAEIMKCSQPYVSQLKAGKGKADLDKISPLINRLSSKSPGTEFSIYSVFKSAKPIFPKDWEEQVLMQELKRVSENDQNGRYPIGDDGFSSIESKHFEAVDNLDERTGGFMSSFNSLPKSAYKDALVKLEEALDLYNLDVESRTASNEKKLTRTTTEVERVIGSNAHYLPAGSDFSSSIEKELRELIKQQFYPYSPATYCSILKGDLIRACRDMEGAIQYPVISIVWDKFGLNDFDDSAVKIDFDVSLFASALIKKCKQVGTEFENEKEKKRDEYRLQKLFSSKEYNDIQHQVVTDVNDFLNWKEVGSQLFGGVVRKVYRNNIDSPYEINMSDAFVNWASDLAYEFKEESIQICGSIILSKSIEKTKLVIHELYSQQFIAISTSHSKELNSEVSVMSKPMHVDELFKHVNDCDYANSDESLIVELTDTLSKRGYKTPGVRAIY